MARDPAASERPFFLALHPWVLILAGLGMTLVSYLVGAAVSEGAGVIRVGLDLLGVAVACTGVGSRLREGRWLFQDRIETAAMISFTGLTALAGAFGMQSDWDSGRMLFGAVCILSLGGVAAVLLPPVGRKIFLSLVLLFHFGGIVTAVTSVDPPNSTGPWVSKQLWARVYRPYLSFLYLSNAYHFYSPDPGPPALLWFSVQYEDGSRTWVRLPERSSSPVSMHYQRLLALPEHTFSPMPRLPLNNSEINLMRAEAQRTGQKFEAPPRGSWEEICQRRELGSTWSFPAEIEIGGKKEEKALPIPMVWGMADYLQYREPHDTSKMLVASVAKRMCLTAPSKVDDNGQEVKVRSVKMYRIVHQVITPAELAKGGDPLDKTRHWAYFLGEFNGEGKLLNQMEPFLYWYVPIQNVPKSYAQQSHLRAPTVAFGMAATKDTFVLDGLEMHAAGPVKK